MADTINPGSDKSSPAPRKRERDKIGGKRGEAVMVVIMGAMLIGGLIVWAVSGEFHMMPMMGGHGHDKGKTETVVPESHPMESGNLQSEDHPMDTR
jgi:hypothetical protein